ncbi:TetR/AcrR family transcriptional regulator [Bacillus sp. FJAT-52991]|uniref:TetR/AcrR family transcriptional regulator n=1 Tax=Bacillus kandeliae TaxID=3129297 RepID=A0ABZ2N8N2_9BACI
MATKETPDKIIDAAIDLIRERGYKAATTKSIAEKAGVNEVTIFRHFGSKRGILESAVQKFSFAPLLSKVIQEEMVWDLEEDLYTIASEYQAFIMSIKDFVLIGLREAGMFPEIDEEIAKIPRQLKQQLMNYFDIMEKKGKFTADNKEAIVMSFIAMNFGFFMSRARLGTSVSAITIEEFLNNGIRVFSRGLTP